MCKSITGNRRFFGDFSSLWVTEYWCKTWLFIAKKPGTLPCRSSLLINRGITVYFPRQIRDQSGSWVDADPVPGMMIILVGEFLQGFSKKKYLAPVSISPPSHCYFSDPLILDPMSGIYCIPGIKHSLGSSEGCSHDQDVHAICSSELYLQFWIVTAGTLCECVWN